ncbi:MAG: AraC family transcriptional regulator [Bacteroidia bacterium]|nr:AraC family transcriptional regulator [Bacteroidia bacterium]
MQVQLNINKETTQLEQMARMFGQEIVNNRLVIPEALGKGFIQYLALPYGIQLHHYQYNLKHKIEVQGLNEEEDGLYMINVNLSTRTLEKKIGDNQVSLSRAGGSGVMFYSPGYHSRGHNEVNKAYEIVFFAFPKETFELLTQDEQLSKMPTHGSFCMYHELTEPLENDLRNALNFQAEKNNAFVYQGRMLELLGRIIQEISEKERNTTTKLNHKDIERQFMVKEILLEHIFGQAPTIDQLAQKLGVSPSKLKSDFKSLFGSSIYQYYLKQKMEIARKLLAEKKGTVSEIGYQLGYSNISQFSSQFKKHFGQSPAQFG